MATDYNLRRLIENYDWNKDHGMIQFDKYDISSIPELLFLFNKGLLSKCYELHIYCKIEPQYYKYFVNNNVRKLSIDFEEKNRLDILKYFPSVIDLELSSDFIGNRKMNNIIHCPNITRLSIIDNDKITTLDFLKFCPKLLYLSLYNVTGLENIDGLQYILNVNKLSLNYCNISDTYVFEQIIYPELDELCLVGNKINNIEFIENMPELSFCNISQNNIKKLPVSLIFDRKSDYYDYSYSIRYKDNEIRKLLTRFFSIETNKSFGDLKREMMNDKLLDYETCELIKKYCDDNKAPCGDRCCSYNITFEDLLIQLWLVANNRNDEDIKKKIIDGIKNKNKNMNCFSVRYLFLIDLIKEYI